MHLPCVDNPDTYRCEARLSVLDEDGMITLEPCCFHPRDSFYPGDDGFIEAHGEKYEVFDVRWNHGKPMLELDRPFKGEECDVTCELDRNRRHDACRLHTALHVLAWIAMGERKQGRADERILPETAILRMNLPRWRPQDLHELETQVNSALEAGSQVRWQHVRREGRNRLPPYISKVFLLDERLESIRIVNIEDFGRQICDGPHVRDIGEVGQIRFVRVMQEEDGLVRFDIKLTQEPGKIYQET